MTFEYILSTSNLQSEITLDIKEIRALFLVEIKTIHSSIRLEF